MVKSGLMNYYGEVCLEKINHKWYLSLDNYDQCQYVEVSETFAFAFQEEFKKTREQGLTEKELGCEEESTPMTPEEVLWKDFLKEVG